jgi:hypothetical protein
MDEYSRKLDDLMRIVGILIFPAGGLKIHHNQIVKLAEHKKKNLKIFNS